MPPNPKFHCLKSTVPPNPKFPLPEVSTVTHSPLLPCAAVSSLPCCSVLCPVLLEPVSCSSSSLSSMCGTDAGSWKLWLPQPLAPDLLGAGAPLAAGSSGCLSPWPLTCSVPPSCCRKLDDGLPCVRLAISATDFSDQPTGQARAITKFFGPVAKKPCTGAEAEAGTTEAEVGCPPLVMHSLLPSPNPTGHLVLAGAGILTQARLLDPAPGLLDPTPGLLDPAPGAPAPVAPLTVLPHAPTQAGLSSKCVLGSTWPPPHPHVHPDPDPAPGPPSHSHGHISSGPLACGRGEASSSGPAAGDAGGGGVEVVGMAGVLDLDLDLDLGGVDLEEQRRILHDIEIQRLLTVGKQGQRPGLGPGRGRGRGRGRAVKGGAGGAGAEGKQQQRISSLFAREPRAK